MKLLFLVLCSLLTKAGLSQVYQFRAVKSTIAIIKEYKESDKLRWVDDDALIVFNTKTHTVKVYGEKTVLFSWVKSSATPPTKLDENTKTTLVYDSIDVNGQECTIQIDFLKPNRNYVSEALIYFRYKYDIMAYAVNVVK